LFLGRVRQWRKAFGFKCVFLENLNGRRHIADFIVPLLTRNIDILVAITNSRMALVMAVTGPVTPRAMKISIKATVPKTRSKSGA
jgi:hypothetical protein